MAYYTEAERIARHYLKYGEYPPPPRQHKFWYLQEQEMYGLGRVSLRSIWDKYKPAIMWGLLGIVAIGITIWKSRR